jgi:hypothetical protein
MRDYPRPVRFERELVGNDGRLILRQSFATLAETYSRFPIGLPESVMRVERFALLENGEREALQ